MKGATTATIHQLDGPNGQPLCALFTGPGALAAALAWAAVLHGQREVLAARGAQWRRDNQRAAWKRARGEGVGAEGQADR